MFNDITIAKKVLFAICILIALAALVMILKITFTLNGNHTIAAETLRG